MTLVAFGSSLWATDGATIDELLDMLEPLSWHADAACREHPELSWFPGRTDDVGPAKAVCHGCLGTPECRAWGLAQGSDLLGFGPV